MISLKIYDFVFPTNIFLQAQILEKYEEGRGACPAGFDVVYVAPRTGNQVISGDLWSLIFYLQIELWSLISHIQITLNTFKCNNVTGKWEATNNQSEWTSAISQLRGSLEVLTRSFTTTQLETRNSSWNTVGGEETVMRDGS